MSKLPLFPIVAYALISNTQAGSHNDHLSFSSPDSPWQLTAEALYLKAEASDFAYQNQDFEFGYRLEASYKNGDDIGIRLRYFDFEGTTGDSFQEQGPDFSSYDLEFFNQDTEGLWDLEYTLGLRYLDYSESFVIGGTSFTDADTDAWGPTFSLEFKRPLTESLNVYIKGRISYVFGESSDLGGGGDTLILEAGTGIEYKFSIVDQQDAFIKLGLEVQQYDDIAVDIDGALFDSGLEDGVLFGGSFSLGFRF